MAKLNGLIQQGRGHIAVALVVVLALALASAPVAPATGKSPSPAGGATFDLYSTFPEQILSPATGLTRTFTHVDVRNIKGDGGEVALGVESGSDMFSATVKPSKVPVPGGTGKARTRVDVTCKAGVPEGTICWVKLTGRRGSESHRIWLKFTALSSQPLLEKSRGVPLIGQGYYDQELQPFVGRPLRWHVAAKNTGGGNDTYTLSANAPFPCDIRFLDVHGKQVKKIKVNGRTRNLLFAKPVELVVEVTPRGELPKDEPQDVTLVLGPGKNSGKTSELKVGVVNPGMLFCMNDLAGLRPHPHQSMPGERTSFIFHVSNAGESRAEVKLSTRGGLPGWGVSLQGGEAALKVSPGRTASAVLRVDVPAGANTGERAEFTVTAESDSGRKEESTVAVEVTEERNIYYWSIDSMDPEYLYMNRDGTGQGRDGDWLMPNIHTFLTQTANYKDARVYLPSATDMNHTNALAGTYTGTQGIYMVGGTYRGFTEHDETIFGPNTMALMKYGPDGMPVKRIYEVAKEVTGGKALTGFWSNKNWLAELEGQRSVDIVGHSESWPLFFEPPYKYRAAGDPLSDETPADRMDAGVKALFHGNNSSAIMIPTLLGQFDLYNGLKLLTIPISLLFGKTPGMHAEDRYIADEFFRSVEEEDPDVSYVNIGDLDNTGHFTGSSWDMGQWKSNDRKDPSWDDNKYSPWMRRDEVLDICREADIIFGKFIDLLKERGTYENSIIAFLSDHGMENGKDPKKGYQVIDLRQILRENGLLRHEDYEESGGTELNMLWCGDPGKCAKVEKILEDFTIDDPDLGKIHPLIVIDRKEMKEGADFGKYGHVRPGELYSEYWINHPGGDDGEVWPDLFVYPLEHYQVMAHGDAISSGINNVGFNLGINTPEQVLFGLPGIHGGLGTVHMPLMFKAPEGYGSYRPGFEYTGEVEIADIAPTIYRIMGWEQPPMVDGKPLPGK